MTTTAPAPAPDPDEPRCGVVRTGGTGLEWVCILPVHAKVYQRRTGSGRNRQGDLIFPTVRADGRPPTADRHLFVRRYPDRGPYRSGE